MKFNSVAEAFNMYKSFTNDQLEARASEINKLIETDENVDIQSLNIELTGIAQAKRNNDEKMKTPETRSAFKLLGGQDFDKNVEQIKDAVSSEEYRSAFYKKLLGRELTDTESRVWDRVQAEHRADAYSNVSEVAGVVPTHTMNEIITKARTIGGLLPFCRAFALPAKVNVPIATPLANAGWNTEGAVVESGEPSIAYVAFGNNEIIKVLSISASVRKMSIDAFEAYLVDELTANVLGTIAHGIVNGDNSTYPVKGLASISWVTSAGSTKNAVTWTGSSNTKLTYKDIIDTVALLKRGYANGAVFAVNNKTLYSAIYDLKDGNNRPLFVADPQTDKIGKILGFEVVVDDNIADDEIYFGNFRYLGYNLVDGIAVEASTQSSFKSGRIDYRGMAIADVQVLVADAFVKCYKSA